MEDPQLIPTACRGSSEPWQPSETLEAFQENINPRPGPQQIWADCSEAPSSFTCGLRESTGP